MPRWANENTYDDLVRVNASLYGVPYHIIKGVMAAESAFNPNARRAEPASSTLGPTADFPQGGDESRGLMQLLVRTARSLGFNGPKDELFRPSVSTQLGTKLLRDNYRRTGDWPSAISMYNGGYRPALAFGAVNTTGAPIRVCLWRKADGSCGEYAVALAGQFGNQAYVDKVLSYARYFEDEMATPTVPSTTPPPPPPPTTATVTPTVVAVGAAVLIAALFAAFKLL